METAITFSICYKTIAPSVMALLKEEKKTQLKNKLNAGLLWKGFQTVKEQETSFVFTDEFGEHLSIPGMYCACKHIVKEIGAPKATVHDLRHTYAVLSLENGDSVKTVQENLGHATASFTLDVYGHVSEEMRQESADKMEERIAKFISA